MPGERLLPCPFCGSPAILNKDIYNFYHVRCGSNCIPSIGGYREPGLAVANWNRRAIPAEESQHVNQQANHNICGSSGDSCGDLRMIRQCVANYDCRCKRS